MKDCDDGTALCGLKIEIEKWPGYKDKCVSYIDLNFTGIGIVGLHFKCCPLPVDSNAGV